MSFSKLCADDNTEAEQTFLSCLGLLYMKGALASVLQVPCGLRRRNIQVDLGALRGLHSSYWKKPGQLAQGDPGTYSIKNISERSLNEGGCCCLELETTWGLFSAAVGQPDNRGLSRVLAETSHYITWMWVWFWTQPVPAVQCPVGWTGGCGLPGVELCKRRTLHSPGGGTCCTKNYDI